MILAEQLSWLVATVFVAVALCVLLIAYIRGR